MRTTLSRTRRAAASILLTVALITAGNAIACTVEITAPNFGTYDPFDPLPTDVWGEIAVDCTAPSAYEIMLDAGSGRIEARSLRSGNAALYYNLFTDPVRTLVWGDGSGLSRTIGGLAANARHPLYGRIPAGQQVPAGTYTDRIMVTVTY